MNKETSEEQEFKTKTDLVILEIGRFTITFEEILEYLKETIIALLTNKGLKDPAFANVILGDPTAEPIRQFFEKITPYCFNEESDQEFIKNILNELNWLNQIRNRIIHCYWVIGIDDREPREPFAMGFKKKVKRGVSFDSFGMNHKQLVELNKEVLLFNDVVFEFRCCVIDNQPFSHEIFDKQLKKIEFQKVYTKM